MEKVLLVGNAPFLRDFSGFLLKSAGFELTLVRDLEEAINRIEINRSLSAGFGLLIVEENDIYDGTDGYFRLVNNLLGKMKILIIGRTGNPSGDDIDSGLFLKSDNIFRCSLENLVCEVRRILNQEENSPNGDSRGYLSGQFMGS